MITFWLDGHALARLDNGRWHTRCDATLPDSDRITDQQPADPRAPRIGRRVLYRPEDLAAFAQRAAAPTTTGAPASVTPIRRQRGVRTYRPDGSVAVV